MDYLDIIKAKRKEAGLTQEEMARLLCLPRSTYQSIESNIVGLKVNDFFRIIKILNIPLELFEDENYIVIPEEDFLKLEQSVNEISNITDKIKNNVSLVQDNIVNQVITPTKAPKSRKQYCRVCNEPSGFYPFCKKHEIMRLNWLFIQDEEGRWIEKKE